MSVEISQLLLWTWNDERFSFLTTWIGNNLCNVLTRCSRRTHTHTSHVGRHSCQEREPFMVIRNTSQVSQTLVPHAVIPKFLEYVNKLTSSLSEHVEGAAVTTKLVILCYFCMTRRHQELHQQSLFLYRSIWYSFLHYNNMYSRWVTYTCI